MAEFTDNLIEFLEDKVKEFNPNFSVNEGTAVRDLTVKPFSVIFQPIVDEILRVRANLSLEDAENLTEADLDRLAANFFISRKQGSKATGVVRMFFNEPIDEFVPQGTVFIAANGVRFLSTADATITSSGLRLNTFGDLFFHDVNVEAETAGVDGNIPANLIADVLVGSDKIVDVANIAAYTGGSDVETNAELVDRLAIAITFRNLINSNGAKLILLENFSRILDVFVVGFGDTHFISQEPATNVNPTTWQLVETEDVIGASAEVTLKQNDELVLTGPGVTAGFKLLTYHPYVKTSGPVVTLKVGASILAGVALVRDTDFVWDQTVAIADEQIATGPVVAGPLTAAKFIPIVSSPAISVRAGASWAAGVDLTLTTHYTVNLGTGVVTLTPAGATLVNSQVTKDVHIKYTATSPDPKAFALLDSGAAAVNAAGTKELHAQYTAEPLDSTLVTVNFDGTVVFGTAPSAGSEVLVDYEYNLMRRDRMSGTGITLGDDTFGNPTNAHIGGRVDYYLKFVGVEEQEARINSMKAENFLFAQGAADPSPSGVQQYVSNLTLPIIPRVPEGTSNIVIIERVDPGTNLPSGIFLTQVPGSPAGPNEFSLEIMPNKLNVNLSTRQRLKLTVSPDVVGNDVFLRYLTHEDFRNVQTFIEDPVNRIVTADLLARAPMPIFVDMEVNYSRPEGGPEPSAVQAIVVDYINKLKLNQCLSIYGLTKALSDGGVKFVQLPITISALRVNLDFTTIQIISSNKLEIPPNFQFIARDVVATEIEFEACDAIS